MAMPPMPCCISTAAARAYRRMHQSIRLGRSPLRSTRGTSALIKDVVSRGLPFRYDQAHSGCVADCSQESWNGGHSLESPWIFSCEAFVRARRETALFASGRFATLIEDQFRRISNDKIVPNCRDRHK